MPKQKHHESDDVEHLLRNAELRDELEPFADDVFGHVGIPKLPTPKENEYLASMLAWERAPMIPIAQWFRPPLTMPAPESLDEAELHEVLWKTIEKMYKKRIVLDFTDHLSDRQLYCLICRDILPTHEKKIEGSRHYLHWDCADVANNPEAWLRFYATEEERELWAEETHRALPPSERPPHPRNLPRRPL